MRSQQAKSSTATTTQNQATKSHKSRESQETKRPKVTKTIPLNIKATQRNTPPYTTEIYRTHQPMCTVPRLPRPDSLQEDLEPSLEFVPSRASARLKFHETFRESCFVSVFVSTFFHLSTCRFSPTCFSPTLLTLTTCKN